MPPGDVRERILAATYECVAVHGLAGTTVEDAARQAGVSRATVYRHFPGGREELVRDTIARETTQFFLRLAEAVADADDFADVVTRSILHAHRAIAEHEVLERLLRSESGRLVPIITVETSRLLPLIGRFLHPYLEQERLREGLSVEEAGEYVARMVLSHINAQGRWDLDDPAQVAELVRTEVLAGVLADDGR